MYKLSFFVPEKECDEVKQSLFAIGVGKLGNYDSCCWQTLGKGQFRALAGSQPHLGEIDQVEYVDEFRVELVCSDELIKEAIETLLKVHPYEEVAYEYYEINPAL